MTALIAVPVATDGDRRCRCSLSDVPLDDPLADGLARLTEGRAPQRPDEILVSAAAGDVLDLAVGDSVALRHLDDRPFEVVGVAELGILPVAVFSRLDRDDLPFVVPWRLLGLLVIAVPLVAGLATSVATRASLRFRPLASSTLTFE